MDVNPFRHEQPDRLVELCCKWLDQTYPPQIGTPGSPTPGLVESIRENLPDLVNHYLLALQSIPVGPPLVTIPAQVQFGEVCAKHYRDGPLR